MAEENVPEEGDSCTRCGMEALGRIGDEILCDACYHGSASCCGFSEDE